MFVAVAACIVVFWCVLYLIDACARLHHIRSYVHYLRLLNLRVSAFQIRVHSTKFVHSFSSFRLWRSQTLRRFFDHWFTLGVGFSILSLIFMTIFLLLSLVAAMGVSVFPTQTSYDGPINNSKLPSAPRSSDNSGSKIGGGQQQQQQQLYVRHSIPIESGNDFGIVPIIPGYNVPWSQVPVLFMVLIVAGVIHEGGHALAALNENVQVHSFGIFIFAIYPGAFTELDSESLLSVKPFRKLKIYCAGIWHNFVLALLAIATLSFLPTLMGVVGYQANVGILVSDVETPSGLTGLGGLQRGMVISKINDCDVIDNQSWQNCLLFISRSHYGYCTPRSTVADALRKKNAVSTPTSYTGSGRWERAKVSGELECCSENETQSHLCFYFKSVTTVLESKGLSPQFNVSLDMGLHHPRLTNVFEHACLPARYVTHHYPCNYSMPCTNAKTHCVYAGLFNNTKLFRITVKKLADSVFPSLVTSSNRSTTAVLFVGHPVQLSRFVVVSNYVPRFRVLPFDLPYLIELTCKYLITLSLALGFINSVTAYSLDGQFILQVLVENLGHGKRWKARKAKLYKYGCHFGSYLLGLNVIFALYKFFK